MRKKLPYRRKCITQRLKINGQTVHFSVGLYPDGSPGELFIDMHKNGTAVRAWCGSTAKLISLMLQYGVPLSELVEALVGECTEREPIVPVEGHPMIQEASGVLDAVMRAMALDYLAMEREEEQDPWLLFQHTDSMGAAEIYDAAETAGQGEALASFLEKFA